MRLVRNEELLFAAKKINLDISEICYGYLDSDWNKEVLSLAFTRIYIPLVGEGVVRSGGQSIPLRPGSIYIIPSGVTFTGECEDRLEKIYIHLTLTHPDGGDLLSGIGRPLVLGGVDREIEQIRALYSRMELCAVLELKSVLLRLLLSVLETHPAGRQPLVPYSPITKAALDYIDEHLSARLGIEEIASSLFISRLALQRRFRADLGKPIGKYLDERLMLRAERALLEGDESIKEISDRLGFCDQFYFSRRFSELHGVSPKHFRLAHRR